jgi:hypothetical protein
MAHIATLFRKFAPLTVNYKTIQPLDSCLLWFRP